MANGQQDRVTVTVCPRRTVGVTGRMPVRLQRCRDGVQQFTTDERLAAEAMGIDWMKRAMSCTQAIPPAYTEFIGRQLHLTLAARAGLEV